LTLPLKLEKSCLLYKFVVTSLKLVKLKSTLIKLQEMLMTL